LKYDAVIIGGGLTETFTMLDLSLRGLNVALIERDSLGSGTAGKYQGMLHSGARYAVNDPVSAKECISENMIISNIAPHSITDTGGLFVAVNDEELNYQDKLGGGLKGAGIPYHVVPVEEILKEELQQVVLEGSGGVLVSSLKIRIGFIVESKAERTAIPWKAQVDFGLLLKFFGQELISNASGIIDSEINCISSELNGTGQFTGDN
jgi:L-2-hydroxyglutarate oxidase LhgO